MTLVDFTDVGDMAVFIDEEQLAVLEKRMRRRGYLEVHDMAIAFNMLRADDLIWSFVIGNYLLGKRPIPFDLLYRNADSTRMPGVGTLHQAHRYARFKTARYAMLVTGSSATADIEGVLIHGAEGVRSLTVALVSV